VTKREVMIFHQTCPYRSRPYRRSLRWIGKAIRASKQEIDANPRARSAVLRIAERLS